MPPISVLMKPASGMCNMKCDYCFYCDEAKKRKQESYGFMTEDTLKNVIRKTMLRAEGYISYVYQGGEPTLRGLAFFEKAVELQHKYNKHGIRVFNALQTNGYEITEEWCQFFKKHHFLVGISIDGIKSTHDRYRHTRNGSPTYNRVLETTRQMDKYGVDYNILTVVNKSVVERVEEIYKEYRRNGWRYQQYIACLDPLDEPHNRNEYTLTPEEYGDFLIRLFSLWNDDRKKGQEPYIRQFDNYVGILRGYRPEACDQRGICGIHNVVEADGSVFPCDFYMLDKYCLGNFNIHSLEQIREKRREIGFVERSQQNSVECDKCEYKILCRGGCQRHKDYREVTGTYQNYFCESYRRFFPVFMEGMQDIRR